MEEMVRVLSKDSLSPRAVLVWETLQAPPLGSRIVGESLKSHVPVRCAR